MEIKIKSIVGSNWNKDEYYKLRISKPPKYLLIIINDKSSQSVKCFHENIIHPITSILSENSPLTVQAQKWLVKNIEAIILIIFTNLYQI